MEIVTRQQWGAAPPKSPSGRIAGPVSKVFIHHTVTPSGPAESERQLMKQLQNIGFSRGFSDISYSYLVFPTGRVYEGRGFGKVGAHTKGHNSTSYGISLVGNYETEPMTDVQVEAVRQMIAEGRRLGFITAEPEIKGHREVGQTACPGRHAFARIAELRAGSNGNGSGGTTVSPGPAFPGILSRSSGSQGPDVCRIQSRLREFGHAIDQVAGCPFGPQTEDAVKAFQRSKGLDDDGDVGPQTWRALFGG